MQDRKNSCVMECEMDCMVGTRSVSSSRFSSGKEVWGEVRKNHTNRLKKEVNCWKWSRSDGRASLQ